MKVLCGNFRTSIKQKNHSKRSVCVQVVSYWCRMFDNYW